MVEIKSEHWTKDEIEAAAQIGLWVGIELMVW